MDKTTPAPITAECTAEADRLLLLSHGIMKRGVLIARSAVCDIAHSHERSSQATTIRKQLDLIDAALVFWDAVMQDAQFEE